MQNRIILFPVDCLMIASKIYDPEKLDGDLALSSNVRARDSAMISLMSELGITTKEAGEMNIEDIAIGEIVGSYIVTINGKSSELYGRVSMYLAGWLYRVGRNKGPLFRKIIKRQITDSRLSNHTIKRLITSYVQHYIEGSSLSINANSIKAGSIMEAIDDGHTDSIIKNNFRLNTKQSIWYYRELRKNT